MLPLLLWSADHRHWHALFLEIDAAAQMLVIVLLYAIYLALLKRRSSW